MEPASSPAPDDGDPALARESAGRTTRRRRRKAIPPWVWVLVAGGAVLVIGGGVAAVFLVRNVGGWFGPRVTQAAFARVEQGMTPAQVRAILGSPDEEVDSRSLAWFAGQGAENLPFFRQMVWTDNRTYAGVVIFLNDGVVVTQWHDGPLHSTGFGGSTRPGDDWQERLKDQRREERMRRHFGR